MFGRWGGTIQVRNQVEARSFLSPNVAPSSSALLLNAFDVGVTEISNHNLTFAQTA